MDFVEIIITIAIIAVGSLLGSGKKSAKKVAPSQASGRRPAQAPMPGGLFKDFSADDLSNEKSSNTKKQKNRDSLGQEYFSYENSTSELNSQSSVNSYSMPDSDSVEKDTFSVLDEPFDFRKAVIYQTIMERVS
ncbi:MAG: hypothetical protein J6Y98_06200 [Bacteroidales bacterium]|nr:hypothetical protein [Bacteroidales bacterium]